MPAQGNASQNSCEGLHPLRALIEASTTGSARAHRKRLRESECRRLS